MWYMFALAAGSLQVVRNAASRRLAGEVSAGLNSWARFAFNLPWALAFAALVSQGLPPPKLSPGFFVACLLGGVGQLLANVALVSAFRYATFAESIVLHKLEVVLTALVGAVLFGEMPGPLGWVGIVVCALGTAAINLAGAPGSRAMVATEFARRIVRLDRGARLALAAGGLLVVASFGVKRAMVELAEWNPEHASHLFVLPAHALVWVTGIEVLLLTAALGVREPGAFRRVPRHMSTMSTIGLTAFCSSLCWFSAFATGIVAYVRAVGQVEAVLAVAVGLWGFRERRTLRQLPGAALIVVGVLLVVLG